MYPTCLEEHGADAGVCIEWMCLSPPLSLGLGRWQAGCCDNAKREEMRREGWRIEEEGMEEGGEESVSETWAFHQSTAADEGGSIAITVKLKLIKGSD